MAPLGLVREFVVRSLADPERHKVSCVLSGRQVDRDLMFRRADQIAAVCKSDKELLRGTVISTNENGYVVRTAGFLVFVPRKLADLPPDADLEEVHPRDSSVELSVIRVDLQRSRIVGSFSDVPIHKSYQKVKVRGGGMTGPSARPAPPPTPAQRTVQLTRPPHPLPPAPRRWAPS